MRWIPKWKGNRAQHVTAVGLDVAEDACRLVLLSGDATHPNSVCCAERLNVPEGLVVHGEVLQPEALGQWLRQFLDEGDYQPQILYVGLAPSLISQQIIRLPSALSQQDIVFQLQADLQAQQPEHAGAVNVDYHSQDTAATPAGMRHYEVHAVPSHVVESLQRVAKAAHLVLGAVEPRLEAALRVARYQALGALTPAGAALALQCDEAFGLALRAWFSEGLNFLPYRTQHDAVLRRAWLLGVLVCAVGGACLAAGFALVIASASESKYQHMGDVVGSARAFDRAQQAYAQAQAQQQRDQVQTQWLQARRTLQAQSLQWSRVLGQSAQGVWVSSVKQQGTHWTVQGEALSSQHAHQLVARLKALDIWAQAPALPQLEMSASPSGQGLPVWQFRIEANLKVGA
jgi:hypothetical protein